MKPIVIDFDDFDFNGFLADVYTFNRVDMLDADIDPTAIIAWLEEGDYCAYYSEGEHRYLLSELFEENKKLFFPISSQYSHAPITFIDGNEYDWEVEYNDNDFVDDRLILEDGSCLGYLLEIRDGKLVINSAQHSLGEGYSSKTIRIEAECANFESVMQDFIQNYIY